MIFSSPEFLAFFAVVYVGFFLIARTVGRNGAIGWLVAASFVFYGWGLSAHVLLLLVSVIGNFTLGQTIRRAHMRGDTRRARALLVGGVVSNLLLLGYFKYWNFFVDNINAVFATSFAFQKLILPLAISFFTLQQVAYLADVYTTRRTEYRFLPYALFVTFFPQLIAGPIVHHKEIVPQFDKARVYRFGHGFFVDGLTIFFLGVFKKTAFADPLSRGADLFFSAVSGGGVPTFFEAWIGALAFSLALYFDFSAYSNMAIGLARMFGIRLPRNFSAPYKATNIIEFWRRWHMTLSRFLRDYVYIPLGGNRKGPVRRHVNLMATMLVGGLWHGAAWTFVAWGGLHAAYLIVNHLWREIGGTARVPRFLGTSVGWVLTFGAVVVGWVYFRADSFADANVILSGMFGGAGIALPAQIVGFIPGAASLITPVPALPLIGGGTLMGLVETVGLVGVTLAVALFGKTLQQMTRRQRLMVFIATFAFALQGVFGGASPVEFIYFRF